MKLLCITLITLVAAVPATAELGREEFLAEYCISCHGPDKQKADRRFDDLSSKITSSDDLERWQEIVDLLNLEEMPPDDEPQPSDAERAAMIASTTNFLAGEAARIADTGGHSVLRRINNWEYRHTIGDLLSLETSNWNPSEFFPAEVVVDGFDNNGAELVTSGMLLDHYLLAAEDAIKRATQFGEKPESKQYRQASPFYFKGKEKSHLPKLFQVDRFRFIPDTPYTDMYGRHYRGGHIGFEPLAMKGVPHSGTYTVRVKAAAVDRDHPYGNALDDFRNGDPLVLELAAVNREGSVQSEGSVSEHRTLALEELTSEDPQWLEWNIYLEKGFEPELRFRNGTTATKRLVRVISSKAAEHPEVAPFENMKGGTAKSHGLLKVYRGPKLRIWEIQVEGPHLETWPPAGHEKLYGKLQPQDLNRAAIRERLESFAESASRRPLKEGELDPILALVNAKLDDGMKPLPALQLGFQTILCSPGFIYLAEGEGPLNDYALASRLSYFLWSSMPDTELIQLAAEGMLRDPATLRAQTTRMLTDPRSNRFVSNFVRLWLNLDSIGEMPISRDFRVYYRDNLDTAMRAETESFFRHLLDKNLPPSELLTADYSFLNRELGMHYGIEGLEGNHMRKVSLADSGRRGLTSQGLFLTASANGVDTSPIVRGIYVLEKILGYTPPPPPPDVAEIESDISAAKSIREQLELHRDVASCAECHRKIDPMGFALENYDAIGGWRDQYPGRLPIDSSGTLPNGDTFETVSEFQQIIAGRGEEFTHCLTEKLLTYALGRELEYGDRETIDSILADLEKNNGGLHDLIRLVVLSDSFGRN
ncbi:MAG: DUF1592 domain-containing protein [Verrucomicrobiota bacterium]